MSHRMTLRVAWGPLVVLMLVAGLVAVLSTPGSAHASNRPRAHSDINFVVVFADDMRADEMRFMSKTRRLINKRGVWFENAVVSDPLCCPSRGMLVTGQYSHNNGVLSNKGKHGGNKALNHSKTVATWAKKAGYNTGWIGKYLNGYGHDSHTPGWYPPGWDVWYSPTHGTYNYSGDRVLNHNGRLEHHRGYATSVYTRLAVRSIKRFSGPKKRPFMLMLAHLAPHMTPCGGGRWCPPEPSDKYRGSLLHKMPKSSFHKGAYNEANVSDKPKFYRELPRFNGKAHHRISYETRRRAEAIRSLDDSVDRITRLLKRKHEWNNTCLIFTSDNGYMAGEHRIKSGKIIGYPESTDVPMGMSCPRRLTRGVKEGAHLDGIVGMLDVPVTFLDAANRMGVANRKLDGRSMLSKLKGAGWAEGRTSLVEAGKSMREFGTAKFGRSYTGVRTDHRLLIKYLLKSKPHVQYEMYDLDRDPDQRKSVHNDPAYRHDFRVLNRARRKLAGCSGRNECTVRTDVRNGKVVILK